MKKIILVAGALLLVGCVSGPSIELSKNFDGWLKVNGKLTTANQNGQIYDLGLAYRYDSSNYNVYIKTYGEAIVNNKNCAIARCIPDKLYSYYFPALCKELFGTPVKQRNSYTYRSDDTLGGNFRFYPQVTSATCYTPKEQNQILVEQKKKELTRIEMALEKKKSKCRTYGFTDNTDGMGLCLIELDKLAAIEQQQLSQNAAIAKQEADAKRQREAQALINLGNLIGNMGSVNTGSGGNKLSSYEVSGMNKICYYNTISGKKTINISRTSICPISYPY